MAERRCRRVSALETGMQCSDRYGVTILKVTVCQTAGHYGEENDD